MCRKKWVSSFLRLECFQTGPYAKNDQNSSRNNQCSNSTYASSEEQILKSTDMQISKMMVLPAVDLSGVDRGRRQAVSDGVRPGGNSDHDSRVRVTAPSARIISSESMEKFMPLVPVWRCSDLVNARPPRSGHGPWVTTTGRHL